MVWCKPSINIHPGVEVSAGKIINFVTRKEYVKDDSTPRDIARLSATPYSVGSSKLSVDGFYVYDNYRNKSYYLYVRFYTDGTVRVLDIPEKPDSRELRRFLKEYPYAGSWGQFKVNGSNISITTKFGPDSDRRDKLNCELIDQGDKLSFSWEMIYKGKNDTLVNAGTLSFFHDSILND